MQIKDNRQARLLVGLGLITRILTDTLAQMFYAFLPLLAAGLGVSTIVFGRLLSTRSAAGLLTPLFGNLAERRGYRVALPAILLSSTLGAALFIGTDVLLLLFPAIFIMGIGITALQPILIAYSSEALPPDKRARGMGIIEYGWALSSIIGVYAVGRLLGLVGWQVVVMSLGVGLGVMGLIFARFLKRQPDLDDSPPISILEQFKITENRSAAWSAIWVLTLVNFAGLHIYISYSIWLFNDYEFDAVALAGVVLTFGFLDLLGSGLVSLLLDRLGRRRAILWSAGAGALVYLALAPSVQFGFFMALGLLFLSRFLFEFLIVAVLIMVSEQAPSQRSRVMSLAGVLTTLAASLASLSGPVAVEMWGIAGLAVPAGIGFAVSGLLAARAVSPTSPAVQVSD
jgi:predicted MFS family arabinose efflux permease